jgi:anti-sigma factor ChrR (cupin superfamily)
MKIKNINDFFKGWFIGDFEPTMLKTTDFEVAVKEYSAGDLESNHVHKEAVEFTMVLDGTISMNGIEYSKNDIILIEKGEATEFKSITDSRTLVVKTPSVKGDKYIL